MASNLSPSDAAFIRELVLRRSAIILDEGKDYLVASRLGQLAMELGLEGPTELVRSLRGATKGLEVRVVEALTTNETSFFRDHYPFEALQKDVLPRMIAARASTRTLNIWSAACSTGQEAYSIAMMILEHFPELAGWPVRILGTDLCEPVVARAREGAFRQLDVNRGLPARLLVKYFEGRAGEWRVKPAVRNLVEFRSLNLLDSWTSVPRPDIVFLRNVLIYFDLAAKRSILKRLRQVMAPDAVLFLGATETTWNVDEAWQRVGSGASVYHRIAPAGGGR